MVKSYIYDKKLVKSYSYGNKLGVKQHLHGCNIGPRILADRSDCRRLTCRRKGRQVTHRRVTSRLVFNFLIFRCENSSITRFVSDSLIH